MGFKDIKTKCFENALGWADDTHVIAVEARHPEVAVFVDGHAVRIAGDFISCQVENHFSVGCARQRSMKFRKKKLTQFTHVVLL